MYSCINDSAFLLQGAKLFYLSGLIHGHYPKADVHNLARFISVMKFRPPDWRGSHPYVIADRLEDLTDPEELRQNPKVDRNISLYGFVRGTHLKPHSAIHIPGMHTKEYDMVLFCCFFLLDIRKSSQHAING